MKQLIDMRKDLEAAIADGRYPVGSQLPTELEFCERYNASRYSVRLVLQELQDLGLIARRKSAGTLVISAQPIQGFTASFAGIDELAQYGATHGREIQSAEEIVVDLALAKQMGCAGGTRWLRISNLRTEGAGTNRRPWSWTDAYLTPQFPGIVELVRASPNTLISTLIEAHYGRYTVRLRQDVRATKIEPRIAGPLGVDAKTPGLQIVRTYTDSANEVLQISVTMHPADRFTLSMELDRSRK